MELRQQLQNTLGDAYTLERELEGGGMSRVFVAYERTLGRRVVIKTLATEFAPELSAERFRREIRLAASLQQANIVPVHSAGEVEGVPYYTMPFVDGESLRVHLASRGRLAPREAVDILRDIARALSFAHDHGVVHRDIKPENVLLSGNTAVVTDFGIAKAVAAARGSDDTGARVTSLTHAGTALGTPAYISPEQAAGDPDADFRSDIYALGVVAYEMLAGASPFAGRSSQAMLAAHIAEPPVPITDRAASTPPALATLVMRCLQKDPAARPQSAREVLDALSVAVTPSERPAGEWPKPVKPSIAVLPFANLSPDPADEYFADGLTDEIITDLSALRALRVIARSSMMRFKGTPKSPDVVARELNVRYALEGSVRRAGASLRLTARLIDADDGSTVWSDKLGGTVEDVFAMQERVSRTIVQALELTLTPREDERLKARPIGDLAAYESFLQARQSMWTFTVPSLDRAVQLLTAALSRIGENARLVAALGIVHLNYLESGQGSPAEHLGAAERAAERLAVIDPDSFGLHFIRGALDWRRGYTREAIASFSRARELDPNSSDVLAYLCYCHLLAGHDDRASECAAATVDLDPLTPIFQCMPGFCRVMAGDAASALPNYRRFLELDPMNPLALLFMAWVLLESNALAEAASVADLSAQRFAGTVFGTLGQAYAHAARGEHREGIAAMTSELRASLRPSEALCRVAAGLLATLGDTDGAIDALWDSVNLGLAHYPFLADRPSRLAVLRGSPRYRALLDVVRPRWERGGTAATDLASPLASDH